MLKKLLSWLTSLKNSSQKASLTTASTSPAVAEPLEEIKMAITPKKAASAASKKNVSSAANKAMKEGKSLKDAISAAKKGK